jgi:glycosyltransferase involved in cell wall biosynthesis
MKVCILVHNHVATDARVIKQADALTEAGYAVTVVGVRNPNDRGNPEWLSGKPWRIIWYHRDKRTLAGQANWLKTAARSHAAECIAKHWTLKAGVAENALIRAYPELVRLASQQHADVYHANDLNTLPVACRAAESNGAQIIYDAHEFYTDEQEGMPAYWREIVGFVERRYIYHVSHVITVSSGTAEALANLYRIQTPTPIYNTPPLSWISKDILRNHTNLSVLYHGNIGFGTRGLDDLLAAVPHLMEGVEIHFRGFISNTVKREIERVAAQSGKPLKIHPPVNVTDLIRLAAQHDVGLVLTQPTCRNNEITTPNKIFEYFLAGLAVITTNVQGLSHIMDGLEVGLMYTPGNVEGLVNAINRLAQDHDLLRHFQENARRAATERYNWDIEKHKLLSIYKELKSVK